MINFFKSQIITLFEKFGFVRKRIVQKAILDKTYKVYKGTISDRIDNDDAWLFALSGRSEHIFDIGSNIGQSAMMMFYHDQIKNIILVDPNPNALSKAAENVILNNFAHKARFINAFLSEKNGEMVDFYTVGSGAAGSKFQSFAKTAARTNSHYKVHTLSIDYLVNHTGITPDLVKVDVEGAEGEVLKGAISLAQKGTASFFVEMHSGEELSITENTQRILDWCKEHAYTAWYLNKKAPLTTEAVKTRGRYHALLLPKDKAFPEYLKSIQEKEAIARITD
ncbi:FkbM family methyltransferase [Ascidiimonas sp. W6]|uniref:FkbM family methyltransferase n=1 Tax=Ascidiimonas meishanensis TaxID=3128903 RepID=UPI0030ECA992